MDNSLQRSSPLRKTSYFEKYRKELERISEEMRSKNNHSTSFSDKSNKDSSHLINPPQLTASLHTPARPPQSSPIKTSNKKPAIFQTQKEPLRIEKVEVRVEVKEERKTQWKEERKSERGDEEQSEDQTRQVELLLGELEAAKGKLARCQQEISSKRNSYEGLRRDLARQSLAPNTTDLQNYAEKMLAIETRMKFKKELHQDELNRLVNERNQRHSENVELSKLIESLEEELQALAKEDLREQEPTAALRAQANKLEAEITRIAQECAEVELKINNEDELRDLSMVEFRRYSEVFRRELVGREVAQAQERVRERNNDKRYLVEIERKKVLVKQRKVENGVRQKALVELTRVMDFLGKELIGLKKQLGVLSDKTAFFGK